MKSDHDYFLHATMQAVQMTLQALIWQCFSNLKNDSSRWDMNLQAKLKQPNLVCVHLLNHYRFVQRKWNRTPPPPLLRFVYDCTNIKRSHNKLSWPLIPLLLKNNIQPWLVCVTAMCLHWKQITLEIHTYLINITWDQVIMISIISGIIFKQFSLRLQ